MFDARLFHLSPEEAASIDPQQRIALETTWTALEDAGIPADRLHGTQTGVFFGVFNNDYARLVTRHAATTKEGEVSMYTHMNSILAGRISHFFDLHGPAEVIDTACSSSLVAVHAASQSLRNGECRMAIAGGVNLLLAPDLSVSTTQTNLLSPSGYCKTFDASADGMVRSDGCGVVVLKLLEDAIADGDHVWGVLRGSAVNHDGQSSSFSAPSMPAQVRVIHSAMAAAGVTPKDISYVEAHGTATPIGDAMELQALAAVFAQSHSAEEQLVVGSVKTNIGHTESAAGVAGLIKVVLSLCNKVIPKHLFFETLNPNVDPTLLAKVPVSIPSKSSLCWNPANNKSRIAGVSSFGFSGTNAHVIVEEFPQAEMSLGTSTGSALLTISSKTKNSLVGLLNKYITLFSSDRPTPSVHELCKEAAISRTHFQEHRVFVEADTLRNLCSNIESIVCSMTSSASTSPAYCQHTLPFLPPKLVFILGDHIDPLVVESLHPVLRQQLDTCDKLARPFIDQESIFSFLSTPNKVTAFAQISTLCYYYAMVKFLMTLNLQPSFYVTSGVGEIAALCLTSNSRIEDFFQILRAGAPYNWHKLKSTQGQDAVPIFSCSRGEMILLESYSSSNISDQCNSFTLPASLSTHFPSNPTILYIELTPVHSELSTIPCTPASLQTALGMCYTQGIDIRWDKWYQVTCNSSRNSTPHISLPTYAFDRTEHWYSKEGVCPSDLLYSLEWVPQSLPDSGYKIQQSSLPTPDGILQKMDRRKRDTILFSLFFYTLL